MSPLVRSLSAIAAAALALAGCGDGRHPLPAIPAVDGPLAPRIVHPAAGARLPAGGRAYVIGSAGSGRATLALNGVPVRVLPNGAFLAYVPVPPSSAPFYDLTAALDGRTIRLRHAVHAGPGPGIDPSTVQPSGPLALADGEAVRVSVQAPGGATVWASAGGIRVGLADASAPVRPSLRPASRSGARTWTGVLPAESLRGGGVLAVAHGGDTARFALPAAALPIAQWRVVRGARGTGEPAAASPTPGGTYRWFLLPGTVVETTGQAGGFVRVRLDGALDAWVAAGDLGGGAAAPERVTGDARVEPSAGHVDLVIPVGSPPPFLVTEGPREFAITLYGARSGTDRVVHPSRDPLVGPVEWDQEASGRVRFTVPLGSPPFGYEVSWADGALVLRVRRPPAVSRRGSLRGLTIVVDPGHPPAGATGPTGLREAEATLRVAQRLADLLRERGATVRLTRTDGSPVGLEARTALARRAGAHALVSIHADAPPLGADPALASGTSTLYFHPHSAPLARAVQAALLDRLGLRDRGVVRASVAVARPTWFPAVLAEGATLVLPEHEAALRDPGFQEAYARALADGLEAYFRALAPP